MLRPLPLTVPIVVAASIPAFASISAQDEAPTVVGEVIDSTSGLPLPEVAVYVDGNHLVALSDTAGEFGVAGLPTGNHTLHLTRAGYAPENFRFTVPPGVAPIIDVGLIVLSPGSPPHADVSGTVIDAISAQAVIAASVGINGERTTFTGDGGAFLIGDAGLHWGANYVEIRRVGYAPMWAALWVVDDNSTLDLDVKLKPLAVQMPEVVVEGDRTTYAYGRIRHFYRRKRHGFGQFFTHADIERIRPIFVSSLLRRMMGVSVVSDGAGGQAIRMFGRRGYCQPLIYLNGIRMRELDIDMFWPDQLEGVEVFRGPSQIPPEFNPTGSACGVVVIWIR